VVRFYSYDEPLCTPLKKISAAPSRLIVQKHDSDECLIFLTDHYNMITTAAAAKIVKQVISLFSILEIFLIIILPPTPRI